LLPGEGRRVETNHWVEDVEGAHAPPSIPVRAVTLNCGRPPPWCGHAVGATILGRAHPVRLERAEAVGREPVDRRAAALVLRTAGRDAHDGDPSGRRPAVAALTGGARFRAAQAARRDRPRLLLSRAESRASPLRRRRGARLPRGAPLGGARTGAE